MSVESTFSFVVEGIGGVVLFCFGVTGNLLSLVALQRDTRTPATTLLQSLAVSDFVLLTCVCITNFIPCICDYTHVCRNLWTYWPQIRYIWFLIPIFHMCSIWLAVLIAGNRYWAVCRPLDTARVWTNRRTCIYIACIVIAVVLFNVPRFFEYKIVPRPSNGTKPHGDGSNTSASILTVALDIIPSYLNSTDGNGPVCDDGLTDSSDIYKSLDSHDITYTCEPSSESDILTGDYEEVKTKFGVKHAYNVIYKIILVNCVLILLPLGFLLLSSVWVIRSLYRHHSTSLVSNTRKQSPSGSDARKSIPSREVTFVLVTVVLVAVVCQAPLAFFHIVRYIRQYRKEAHVFYLEAISKCLLNINACVNFVIYCVLCRRFRRLLFLVVTCTPKGKTKGQTCNGATDMGLSTVFK